MAYKKNPVVILEDTKFIFRTNFAGDPGNDAYGNAARRGNIIIPTEELAREIADLGIDVKATKPREGEEEGFKPIYFMPIIINYRSEVAKERPPKVYLVSNGVRRLLDEESVGSIDRCYVLNVNATVEITYLKKYDKYCAYVQTMYVEQDVDEDPFASRYRDDTPGRQQPEGPTDDEEFIDE